LKVINTRAQTRIYIHIFKKRQKKIKLFLCIKIKIKKRPFSIIQALNALRLGPAVRKKDTYLFMYKRTNFYGLLFIF